MATPPDFSPGQVLTAAHMDAVGLWLVKSQTIGTGVSSVTVTDAFSADYDNYRIVFSGIDCSTTGFSWYIQFGGAASNYYGSSYYDLYTGGTTGTVRQNAGTGLYVGVQDLDNTTASIDVLSPYKTALTNFYGNFYGGGYSGWASGTHAVATSHTSITMALGSGTMTGGTITVYGYRN